MRWRLIQSLRTGFATSSPEYVGLQDQPGISPAAYIPLQNTTMTYWFIANDRHIKGVIKTASSYQPFYIGFLNAYATEAEYPYPLAICGTYHSEVIVFGSNTVSNSSFLNPAGSGSGIPASQLWPTSRSCSYIRFTDGIWYKLQNIQAGSGNNEANTSTGAGLANVWPMSSTTAPNFPPENLVTIAPSIALQFRNTTPGGIAFAHMLQALGSPRSTILFPMTAFIIDSNQLLGDLDGCYWCPAAGGITSEDIITDSGESPEVDHIVFQNVWRTDEWMFLALRNE